MEGYAPVVAPPPPPPSSSSPSPRHQLSLSSAAGASSKGELAKAGGAKKKEKTARRHRFAFQTRSQVDILDDGYRWRKSYYRCTYQGCNVKKQVQRLSKDEGVVVTTYEGVHSHPIDKPNDNFEHILKQMQVYAQF
ncbi:hypothetical protein ZIOFF_000423 [Zingiber officinale]|uniref:WRKY domain-containing protein n=1 Tax=Zingiber officinale TaxID=94328 RepID=A0A8J5I882_ZINOF|nr:hypothetical protein ZIOFF_000423 [Zingiber officinale]